jgi:hypothetical protein
MYSGEYDVCDVTLNMFVMLLMNLHGEAIREVDHRAKQTSFPATIMKDPLLYWETFQTEIHQEPFQQKQFLKKSSSSL